MNKNFTMKVFNFGLPRTGTTSFHMYMKDNGFDSVHTNDGFIDKCFPNDYFDFLLDKNVDTNSISNHIENHQVFSDLPFYSAKLREKLINKYKNDPNVVFVYTTRSKEKWVESIKKIIPHIKSTSEKAFHKMEYNNILVENVKDSDLRKYYDEFHSELKLNTNIYPLSLEDIEDIKITLNKLCNTDINMKYPSLN
jgi:hypothetical protein